MNVKISQAHQQIFISNPRNFFLPSSSLPTAVTRELLNFPETLLGDVRKEYLMPKICFAETEL